MGSTVILFHLTIACQLARIVRINNVNESGNLLSLEGQTGCQEIYSGPHVHYNISLP